MTTQKKIIRWFGLSLLGFIVLFMLCFLCAICSLQAQAETAVPRAALMHRAELTRVAHAAWGLNAPIPAFAAQIQQESAWRADAVSHVGAQGMAQFMPATAKWWCEINNLNATDCQPNNPTWALRSLVGYDLWLYQRVWGAAEYDRLYATLRSYNGGLDHWQREAKIAQSNKRNIIDAACGKARRHISFCKENLNYPKRILNLYQARYASWGHMVNIKDGEI
jgi:soluble lytic murein transglycosylase-like protein